MKSIIFLSFLLFGCSTSRHNNSKLATFNFNGVVTVNLEENFSEKINKRIPVKSEICLMQQDSTIIVKTVTDSIGQFSVNVKIDTTWNPLLLKVIGLENTFLDTTISGKRYWNSYNCDNSVFYRPIVINSNQKKIIKLDCVVLERDITPPQY